jgi:hypothetical protein
LQLAVVGLGPELKYAICFDANTLLWRQRVSCAQTEITPEIVFLKTLAETWLPALAVDLNVFVFVSCLIGKSYETWYQRLFKFEKVFVF